MAILAGIIEGGVQYTGQTLSLDPVFSEFVENILKILMFKTLAPGLIAFNSSKLFFSSTSESKYKSSSATETLSFYSYYYIIPAYTLSLVSFLQFFYHQWSKDFLVL